MQVANFFFFVEDIRTIVVTRFSEGEKYMFLGQKHNNMQYTNS